MAAVIWIGSGTETGASCVEAGAGAGAGASIDSGATMGAGFGAFDGSSAIAGMVAEGSIDSDRSWVSACDIGVRKSSDEFTVVEWRWIGGGVGGGDWIGGARPVLGIEEVGLRGGWLISSDSTPDVEPPNRPRFERGAAQGFRDWELA